MDTMNSFGANISAETMGSKILSMSPIPGIWDGVFIFTLLPSLKSTS